MKLRSLAFACLATFALAGPLLADDVRVATAEEQLRVSNALTKAGYTMPDSIRVDNDKFKAYAKSKDGKDVEVTLDLNSLKVLGVESVKK
jgi:Peptidase propeptide and YPEB domain